MSSFYMVTAKTTKTKSTKAKLTKSTKTPTKSPKREPTPAAVLKKVAAVSDSNKILQKEIKSMTKIFGENQKVLVAMKGMIDTLASTLAEIQKQSRQINNIEADTQKLYSDLNQIRTQSNMIAKLNTQTSKLQNELQKITEEQRSIKSSKLVSRVEESTNSIKNNSQMIIKIGQYVDEIKDNLRMVTKKTDQVLTTNSDIEKLRSSIDDIAAKTSKMETSDQIVQSLRQELGNVASKLSEYDDLVSDLTTIKIMIDSLSSKASKIDSVSLVIDSLKQDFDTISSDTVSAKTQSTNAITELGNKIDKIEFDINNISGTLKKQDESVESFHNTSDKLFQEIQVLRDTTSRSSDNSSKEMVALLRLAEYQSSIRMNGESKYGDTKDLENMAKQTVGIVNLFDKISVDSGQQIPLPHEVRQWAVSKILDCADKWEIRFSDVYSILANTLGRDMLKDVIKIPQIRDIYGIRAVDELRQDLNIP